MTIRPPTMCDVCSRSFDPITRTCSAFPAGIPSSIHPDGITDHRKSVPGDGGIRFAPTSKLSKSYVKFVLGWFDEDKEAALKGGYEEPAA